VWHFVILAIVFDLATPFKAGRLIKWQMDQSDGKRRLVNQAANHTTNPI